MFTRYFLKNNNYLISKRDYLSDYSRIQSKNIDMTLSGKYLSKVNEINIDTKIVDEYPNIKDIELLENSIKIKEKTNMEIIIGSGANGILHNLVKIFFRDKGNLVTPFYTFNQVEFAVTAMGGYTKRVYMDEYKINFEKLKKSIDKHTKMIYICNPNNPTGIYVQNKLIINLAKKVKIPIVVDESGIEFTDSKSMMSEKNLPNNIIVVRSFSKAYGIANFRIGYAGCTNKLKEKYNRNVTTNEFSGISCLIALERLKKNIYIEKNIELIKYERKKMEKELEKLKINVIHSKSNTIMTTTTFDETFLEKLENNNISVVPIYDENNMLHIRIAIQDKNINNLFIETLKKILVNGG